MTKACMAFGLLLAACSLEGARDGESLGSTAQAASGNSPKTTKIKVNGRSAFTFLVDDLGTNGFLTVTQDQIANTFALDFSYASPDPTNPDFFILFQGAGPIPNAAVTYSGTSTHLALTTPPSYEINRCVINNVDGTFTCASSGPLAFDLTWTQNKLGSVHEKTIRTETLGPVTTKINAEYTTLTAGVTGTFAGHVATNLSGELTDSQSATSIREITLNRH
ncbi:MAG TPA: hypothetical protein VLT33_17570 [Labilithrix sp.]|nr:hypothetical protein [Labilithrix sp.]